MFKISFLTTVIAYVSPFIFGWCVFFPFERSLIYVENVAILYLVVKLIGLIYVGIMGASLVVLAAGATKLMRDIRRDSFSTDEEIQQLRREIHADVESSKQMADMEKMYKNIHNIFLKSSVRKYFTRTLDFASFCFLTYLGYVFVPLVLFMHYCIVFAIERYIQSDKFDGINYVVDMFVKKPDDGIVDVEFRVLGNSDV
jgi:hypothetical protein